MTSEQDGRIPGIEAVEQAGQRLDRLPQALLLRWAGALRAQGDAAAATRVLAIARQRHGAGSTYLEAAARVAWAAGERDAAERLLRERAERFPSATSASALARLLLEAGRLDEAAMATQQLLAERPDLATVTGLAADLARAQGNLELARAHYLGVIDADGERAHALITLADLSLDAGDDATAIAFLRRARAAVEAPGAIVGAATLERLVEVGTRAGDTTGDAAWREQAAANRLAHAAKLRAELDAAFAEHRVFADGGQWGADVVGDSPPPETPALATLPAVPPPSALPPIAREPQRAPAVTATPLRDAVPLPPMVAVSDESEGDPPPPEVLEALREWYGHDQFRDSQWAVIREVLAGRDTLAIIPTGGGKSLTYQLPAMLLPGVTLVVSPLIALMKDQVESAPAAVRDRVALLNSDLQPAERQQVLGRVASGDVKLLYVAPERMLDPSLRDALLAAGLSLVVVDEAHCVSMWGHDFRPDYLAIPLAIRQLQQPAVLAVTATATPQMGQEIRSALGRPQMREVRASVYRSNLYYEVISVKDKEAKIAQLIEICRTQTGAGIVYVPSRRDAEQFAETLVRCRISAAPYHAGLDRSLRTANQERFMSGETRIVVATVAFGMGIDKADVRFIVHTMPPSTVEAYAQETGRAGRDGEPSRCVLLTAGSDRTTLRTRARRDLVEIDELRKVYKLATRNRRGEWAALDSASLRSGGDDETDPKVALGYLGQAGLVARVADAPVEFAMRKRATRVADGRMGTAGGRWAEVVTLLGPTWEDEGAGTLETATACGALGLEPAELDALLSDVPGLQVTRGRRMTWFRIPAAGPDAGPRLERLLQQARLVADARIETMMDYIDGNACRHVALADALGEALPRCGTTCDVCAPTSALPKPAAGATAGGQRKKATASEAATALVAMRDLPFSLGKAGLVRLLSGAADSRIREDRSAHFGALAGLAKRAIESLIDELVAAEMLEPHEEGEYRMLRLTRAGLRATEADLGRWFAASAPERDTAVRRREKAGKVGGAAAMADADLDVSQLELYDRLVAWRLREAKEQLMPPYVIGHNAALRVMALQRPTTLDELAGIHGFGQSRAEKYGAAILRIIADEA